MSRQKKTKASTAAKKKRLTWRQRVILLSFGLALLAIAEIVVRVAGLAPSYRAKDPLLEGGEQDRAYAQGALPSGEAAWLSVVTRPEFPYNFQPIPVEKPANETRIFVFGGSSAVGYPYDGRLAFSSFLQAGLSALWPDRIFRVINVAQNNIAAGRCLVLMQEMADYRPDIFLVYSGNNEYDNDHVYRHVLRRRGLTGRVQSVMGHLALYRGVERLILPAKVRLYESFELTDDAVTLPAYTPQERRAIADNYAYVIDRMADLCAGKGIRLALCTVAANAADWPPYRSTFAKTLTAGERKAFLDAMAGAIRALGQGGYALALETLDNLSTVDAGRADMHFLRGVALAGLARHAEAEAAFDAAMDLDNVCYRARPSQNRVLFDVAAGTPAVGIDTREFLKEHAEHRLLGEQFFWDHCHPRPEAHALLALKMAREMFAAGQLPPPPADWEERFTAAVEEWRARAPLSDAFHARALRNTASGWMGLWTSHHEPDDLLRNDRRYLDRAMDYLDRAIAIDPACPGAHFYRGVIHAQFGEIEKANDDWRREEEIGSPDGPMENILAGLLEGSIDPQRGFQNWLFIRNEMAR